MRSVRIPRLFKIIRKRKRKRLVRHKKQKRERRLSMRASWMSAL
jgi:hypothetical protein